MPESASRPGADPASTWIRALQLRPHPEGGYFRETYRAAESIPRRALPARFPGPRAFSTAIYFLLRAGQVSRLHRIRSDETWHFHAGAPLIIHLLTPDGRYRALRLGVRPDRGEHPQAVVPAGAWFGAVLAPRGRYALVGCTVAPGFDFADFALADRADLTRRFPRHRRLIEALTCAGD